MARRSLADAEGRAVEALVAAFGEVGIEASVAGDSPAPGERSRDGAVVVAGRRVGVEFKSVVTASLGEMLAKREAAGGAPVMLVAERIASDAKRALRREGVDFFDMRGHLRYVDSPVLVDTAVQASPGARGRDGGPLDSQVAKEVAIACLSAPDRSHGVREVARWAQRSPSSVSAAMRGLRDAGLLTSAGEPLCPELFEELAGVWRPRPAMLAAVPDPTPGGNTASGLRLGADGQGVGWALRDTLAASAWGIPMIARGDYPPDFFVADGGELDAARVRLGTADDPAERGCTVAVTPVRVVCLRREMRPGTRWPVVGHIVAALDMARDLGRGAEALRDWAPEGIARAW